LEAEIATKRKKLDEVVKGLKYVPLSYHSEGIVVDIVLADNPLPKL
jgi:hypothetical protein